jgi:hypothetical protein
MLKHLTIAIAGVTLLLAGSVYGSIPRADQPCKIIVGDEEVATIQERVAAPPMVIGSPGDIVGYTTYDYQHNGSISKMKVVEPMDGSGRPKVHMAWMQAWSPWTGDRHIYYNYRDRDGVYQWPGVGTQVDPIGKSGYTTMDCMADGRAVVAYHGTVPGGTVSWTFVSVDSIQGAGVFDLTTAVDSITYVGDYAGIWPHVSVGENDYIHVAAQAHPAYPEPNTVYYSRSIDGGLTYETWRLMEDSVYCVCAEVAADKHSPKVVVAYIIPARTPSVLQWNGDVWYAESEDYGASFGTAVNVTSFPAGAGPRAYTDVDPVYDCDGNLHLVFTVYNAADDTDFNPYESAIMHWSEATGLTTVAPATGWYTMGAYPGGWRCTADRPSLAIDCNTGFLYCIWVVNSDADLAANGYPNGEIYGAYSRDGGATWSEPINLTNSPTPGCAPGTCDDDDYPSLAFSLDDELHILFINDKDAGGIPQTEGTETNNPVMDLGVHTCEFTALSTDIVPDALPPIVVPQEGGKVGLTIKVKNCSDITYTTDVWVTVTLPNGKEKLWLTKMSVKLIPGKEASKHVNLNVPAKAPSGTYIITCYIDSYSGEWLDKDCLKFTKQ